MKKLLIALFPFMIVVLILSLTVRGLSGNPDEQTLQNEGYKTNGPLELSPERGRFGLTYSMAENGSFEFTLPVARFITPDVAYHNGSYVSLFAPGVSIIVLPGYFIGKIMGISQVGTFAVVSLFAFLNYILIYATSRKLNSGFASSHLGAIAFLFATPAFTYAVTLYQHHISVFLLLLSIYLIISSKSLFRTIVVWVLIGVSIAVDYPNIFLMLPIGIYAILESFHVYTKKNMVQIQVKTFHILAGLFIVLPAALLLWYNTAAYGNPMQLSGTLRSVDYIDEKGNPVTEGTLDGKLVNRFEIEEAVGTPTHNFFETRNILNGLYVHFLSFDRGILFYAPIVFFSILGGYFLYSKYPSVLTLLASIAGVNVALYSMWGDPWGGWAFGSRYLIPTYAMSGILIAAAFHNLVRKKSLYLTGLFILLLSIIVNSLGALTTSKMPPQIQVLALEELTGEEEKYTIARNIDYLTEHGSQSFVYQMIFDNAAHPIVYSVFVILILFSAVTVYGYLELRTKK